MSEAVIELKHITQEYDTADGKGKFFACKDVNVHVKPGDIFGIIGRSGAGKSTLVRCINLLNRPTSGSVIVDGKDLTKMPDSELREERRSIGMIFQHFNLLMQKSVLENVCFPLYIQGKRKGEARKRALELLKIVGLEDKAKAYPAQLSGGQKQRVVIARALIHNRSILLVDEGTSALDQKNADIVEQSLLDNPNLTLILVSHHLTQKRKAQFTKVYELKPITVSPENVSKQEAVSVF